MANQFGRLASGIVQYDFDYITGTESVTEVDKVSGWLQGNLGQLNTLLYSSFATGVVGLETGWASGNYLKQEENAIFTQLYLQDYYNKQGRIALRSFTNTSSSSTSSGSADYTMTPWTTLKEGDTTITRDIIKISASSRTQAARSMQDFAKAAEAKLKDLVYKYNYYQAHPRQTAGSDGG